MTAIVTGRGCRRAIGKPPVAGEWELMVASFVFSPISINTGFFTIFGPAICTRKAASVFLLNPISNTLRILLNRGKNL